jgi:hypothetical protein
VIRESKVRKKHTKSAKFQSEIGWTRKKRMLCIDTSPDNNKEKINVKTAA